MHACNSNCLGSWDWENSSLRPAWANKSWDPHLQNNHSKMDWRCGSSGTAPALSLWSPEFKLWSHKTKNSELTFLKGGSSVEFFVFLVFIYCFSRTICCKDQSFTSCCFCSFIKDVWLYLCGSFCGLYSVPLINFSILWLFYTCLKTVTS
jgi:hypothetical protein